MRRMVALLLTGLALAALGLLAGRWQQYPVAAGCEAYRRGDYAAAAEHFDQARQAGKDSPLLSHNQGAALYQLQRYGDADDRYQEAGAKGSALEAARAAYDRGNCALRRACGRDGAPDPKLLGEAIQHYQSCLDRRPAVGDAGTLFDDARHNLEMAKLLTAKQEDKPDATKPPPDPQTDPQSAARDHEDLCPV